MKLSEHFSLEEMTFSESAQRLGIFNEPNETQLKNLFFTAEKMEEVRKLLGDRPIFITSGFRSLLVNKLIHGSVTSAHKAGLACDFKVAGLSTQEAAKMIAHSDIVFDQLILEYSWVHIGFGDGMRRQIFTKKSPSFSYQVGLAA